MSPTRKFETPQRRMRPAALSSSNVRTTGDRSRMPSRQCNRYKFQVVRAEPSEAPLASAADPRRIGMRGQHLRHNEDVVALADNNPANHFLGEAITVGLRGIDQRQAERDPEAHRLFLGLDRMSHLAQMPRALPKRRNERTVPEADGPGRGSRSRIRGEVGRYRCQTHRQTAEIPP